MIPIIPFISEHPGDPGSPPVRVNDFSLKPVEEIT
jgi:hypothetical protein